MRKNHSLPQNVATVGDRYHPFPGKPRIYIVRDGRDVLTSCYYWHLKSGEVRDEWGWRMKERDWEKFEEFLRSPIFMHNNVTVRGAKNPIWYWKHHVRSWIRAGVPWFRYEDLINDEKKTLKRIGETLGLKVRKGAKFERFQKLVGFSPRKGIIGDWRNLFNVYDLKRFNGIAGDLMAELGYE